MRIDNNKINFKGISSLAKPLASFYNPNATALIFLIETGVTLGRSAQAKKRGGIKEATDRFIEQGASAAIWIWGVQALKKAGEFLGKKILKQDLSFDLGSDYLRNPVSSNNISKKALGFKMGNLLLSTALATYFIGFLLPKISLAAAKKAKGNDNKKNVKESFSTLKSFSLEDFQKNTKRNITFTSLFEKTKAFSSMIESNSTARLFITDTGVIAGRCYSAKSKYRKIENLFRDISSIYFYLFSTGHIAGVLNKATNTIDINPKLLSKTLEMLKNNLGEEKLSASDFIKLTKGSVNEDEIKMLDGVFGDKKILCVDDFVKKFPKYKEKAYKMSKLQPELEGVRVLSKNQARDVLNSGLVSDPEFLFDAMNCATDGASSDKFKYVSAKKLDGMRKTIDEFLDLFKNSKEKITYDTILKKANKNINKSFGFYAFATAVSIYALGVLIPKAQYAITRKLTNKDEFRE